MKQGWPGSKRKKSKKRNRLKDASIKCSLQGVRENSGRGNQQFKEFDMTALSDLARRTAEAAVAPGILTTSAVSLAGYLENSNAAAPLNAVSHIPFGEESFEQEDPTFKYTVTGSALNIAAVVSWAAVYEYIFGEAARRGSTWTGILGGAAVAGLAYVTDYYIVPARLTPGFERRLSGRSMFGVYALLAATLPLASLMTQSRDVR